MLSEQGKDEKKLCMSTSRYLTFPIFRKRTKVNTKQLIVQTISEIRIWRRDKSERRLRWQDKEHQLETESTKKRFSWVLFKSLFLFQKAVKGLGISLAYHVPSKAQGIPNSVSQHFHPTYCGDFVQEEDFWFVSRVGDDELPDFFSCVDTESHPGTENNTLVPGKHVEEWQSCFSTSFIKVNESSASCHNGAM